MQSNGCKQTVQPLVICMPAARRAHAERGPRLLDAACQKGIGIESIYGRPLTCAQSTVRAEN